MKYVITIGREYGSGGHFIAKLLAERLGIAFYDNELLLKIAETSNLSEDVISEYDEKKEGLFSSGINLYSSDLSLGSKVFLAQFEKIKEIAENESCVIVGRCADYILKNHPNLVNVFITAPMDEKIARAIKYYGLDPKKAEKIINKKNKKRKDYYTYYTNKEWGNAQSYDICINSKIGIDECVDSLEAYVKTRFKMNDE
jgi:cytidylate kinase